MRNSCRVRKLPTVRYILIKLYHQPSAPVQCNIPKVIKTAHCSSFSRRVDHLSLKNSLKLSREHFRLRKGTFPTSNVTILPASYFEGILESIYAASYIQRSKNLDFYSTQAHSHTGVFFLLTSSKASNFTDHVTYVSSSPETTCSFIKKKIPASN